ncbi:hypothetical protein ABTX81_35265 [Kitasatospora sp. NPDC097605]|uniref:hypothetical protein n=1 Tax=Kitasatospora sp. NPDC097605 TaxID=3157226 RepID=UPI0033223EB7
MDIVIVGAGKAGSLHYRAYSRLARSGRLDLARIQFVDRTGRPGAELDRLLRADGSAAPIARERALLAPTAPASTIVDLCLPSRSLAPALIEWWQAGYRRFVVEKPFLVAPELRAEVGRVLADSRVVLVRNYLHSKVHRTVRELVEQYELDPSLCVTNFSKDRRADNLRGRGASGTTSPTVFEVELPHQLYIGADLLGEPVSVEHAEDLDPMGGGEQPMRLGEGVVVGRAAGGAAFVHYSDLQHPTTVRTLDLLCRERLSVHATYAPICEELTDIKAGVFLCRGETVLAKSLFTVDDNMLAMISTAHAALTSDTPGPQSRVDLDEVLRPSELIHAAIAGRTGAAPVTARPGTVRSDILQEWVVDAFRQGLATGVGRAFLAFLEQRRRDRMTRLLPALDPAFEALARAGATGEAVAV